MTLSTLLLVIAFVLFVLATFNIGTKINLVPLGLACCVLSVLSPSL